MSISFYKDLLDNFKPTDFLETASPFIEIGSDGSFFGEDNDATNTIKNYCEENNIDFVLMPYTDDSVFECLDLKNDYDDKMLSISDVKYVAAPKFIRHNSFKDGTYIDSPLLNQGYRNALSFKCSQKEYYQFLDELNEDDKLCIFGDVVSTDGSCYINTLCNDVYILFLAADNSTDTITVTCACKEIKGYVKDIND